MSKPRTIFEETTAGAPRPAAPVPGAADARRRSARRAIAVWLVVLAAMVAGMVLVGGLPRLTDSGLSITDWPACPGPVLPGAVAACPAAGP